MSLEKVAIKNERPGIMLTPALRLPREDHEEVQVDEQREETAPAKA